tara:strand:+ start:1063 stop:1374 length:312 start_codon:yes stop_codon:yes gene_type:complete
MGLKQDLDNWSHHIDEYRYVRERTTPIQRLWHRVNGWDNFLTLGMSIGLTMYFLVLYPNLPTFMSGFTGALAYFYVYWIRTKPSEAAKQRIRRELMDQQGLLP